MSADVLLRIGGEEREGGAGAQDVIDPSTGEPAFRVALADARDLDDALAAADASDWPRVPAAERGAVLKAAAERLAQRAGDIARGLTIESGKLLPEAEGELGRAVETLAWNGEEAGRIGGRLIEGRAGGARREVVATPIGVVAAFTAWNFPAVLAARKLGAALAAGCPVVLKASEETPRTAAAIVAALEDAGLPAGTVNLVFGDPPAVSAHLLASPIVKALTFTGSTAVGMQLARLAGLRPAVLELGGHAPAIVCADADVDAAIDALAPAKYGSAGQSCVAPSRFYIHESRYDEFATKFAERSSQTTIGPVIGERRVRAMERFVADARARGARVLTGGERSAASTSRRPCSPTSRTRLRSCARSRSARSPHSRRSPPGRTSSPARTPSPTASPATSSPTPSGSPSRPSATSRPATSASTRWRPRCPTRRWAASTRAGSGTRAAARACARSCKRS